MLRFLAKRYNWQQLSWGCAVLLIWGGLGGLGHGLIAWSWRSAQVGEFEHTVLAVATLAAEHPWQQPWESDPAWRELEKSLDVDLVPLPAGNAQPVTWIRTPAGHYRASLTVPLTNSVSETKFIRGTRVYDDHGIDTIWWLIWSSLNLIWVGTMLVFSYRLRRRLNEERAELAAWSQSQTLTQTAPGSSDFAQSPVSLLEELREGVLLIDRSNHIQIINSTLCDQLDINANESLVGRQLLEVVRVPAVVELIEHCSTTRKSSQHTIEVGATPRYLHLLATPIVHDEQDVSILLTAIDVSSAQRSELARREFVAGASHELKTPLAAIRAYTETLQSLAGEDPAASERFLQKILDQADRMDRLVNSMLQLARAESGTLKLNIQPIDVELALKSCVEAAAGMAEAKGLIFESHLPQQRTLVLADRDALQTIASNLLSNAIRYTPSQGQVALDVFEEPTSPQGQCICLRVSDTGIGIPTSDQARIFERFYRVQKDRALDSGGTGLGLAIVKQLTQVLDGSVKVISRPGEGTRFEIRLPAVGFTQSSSNVGSSAKVFQR